MEWNSYPGLTGSVMGIFVLILLILPAGYCADAKDVTICDCQLYNHVSEGDRVTVTGICMIPPDVYSSSLFILSTEEGGPWCSISVYDPSHSVVIEKGQCATCTGTLKEFYDLTEIILDESPIITVWDCGWPMPDPVDIGSCDIGEPYESVIVRLTCVTICDLPNEYYLFPAMDEQGCEFWVRFSFSLDPPDPGDEFCAMTGVLNYSWDEFQLRISYEDDLDRRPHNECPYCVNPEVSICDCQKYNGVQEGDRVKITGICTMAPGEMSPNSFILSTEEGGPWCAIKVVDRNGQVAVQRGQCVTCDGVLTEYYNDTEVVLDGASNVNVWECGWDMPEPAHVENCTVDESLEDVLVQYDCITVEDTSEGNTTFVRDIEGCSLPVYKPSFPDASSGDHYCAISGIMSNFYDNFSLFVQNIDQRSPENCPYCPDTVSICDVYLHSGEVVRISGICTVKSGLLGYSSFILAPPEGGRWCAALVNSDSHIDVKRGQCVTCYVLVDEYYGQYMLRLVEGAPVEIEDCGQKIPDPIPMTDCPDESLEYVLVEDKCVTIVDYDDQYAIYTILSGMGCTYKALFPFNMYPQIGDEFCSIIGFVDWHFGDWTIRIRDADDVDVRGCEECPWNGTACDPVIARPFLNRTEYSSGDTFIHTVTWTNLCTSRNVLLFDVLEVNGNFWFWPGWSQDIDFKSVELPELASHWEEILRFTWPDNARLGGRFWVAALSPDMTSLLGDIQFIDFSAQ